MALAHLGLHLSLIRGCSASSSSGPYASHLLAQIVFLKIVFFFLIFFLGYQHKIEM